MSGEKLTVLVVEPRKKPYAHQVPARLEDYQALVGGDIEAVYPFDESVALVCHSEGKLQGLPLNRALTDPQGMPYDIVCGTFFVAGLSGETFTSLTEDQLRCYQELFDNHIVLTVPAQSQPEKTHPKKGKKYER